MNWHRVVTLKTNSSIRPEPPVRAAEPQLNAVLSDQALASLIRLAGAQGEDAQQALVDAMNALGAQADACAPLLDCLMSRAEEVGRLRQLAGQDELTGVSNRRAFNDALQREASRCKRTGGSLAVLYVDLDGLKLVNDRHGHRAGDEAIRAVAEACVEMVRGSDLVARLGGDEFAVLLPDVDTKGGEIVRERMRERIERTTICGQRLRTSIGLAVMEGDKLSGETLVALADAELYRDKQERKSLAEMQAA